jgi:hypothetical protein
VIKNLNQCCYAASAMNAFLSNRGAEWKEFVSKESSSMVQCALI